MKQVELHGLEVVGFPDGRCGRGTQYMWPFNVSNWSPGHGRLRAVYGLCLRVRLVGHVCVSDWMSGGAGATGACRPVEGRGTCGPSHGPRGCATGRGTAGPCWTEAVLVVGRVRELLTPPAAEALWRPRALGLSGAPSPRTCHHSLRRLGTHPRVRLPPGLWLPRGCRS